MVDDSRRRLVWIKRDRKTIDDVGPYIDNTDPTNPKMPRALGIFRKQTVGPVGHTSIYSQTSS